MIGAIVFSGLILASTQDRLLHGSQRFPIDTRNISLEKQLNERNIPLETSEEGEPTSDAARWRLKTPSMERYISPLMVDISNKSKILDVPTWGLSKESWEKRNKLEEILNNSLVAGKPTSDKMCYN